MYKRYNASVYGDVGLNKKFRIVVKALKGNRRKVNEGMLLRKLILRPDILQPLKKSKKPNFKQKLFRMKQIIKMFYGNWRERQFKKFMRNLAIIKKAIDVIAQLENRLETILYRVFHIKSRAIAKKWIENGKHSNVRELVQYISEIFVDIQYWKQEQYVKNRECYRYFMNIYQSKTDASVNLNNIDAPFIKKTKECTKDSAENMSIKHKECPNFSMDLSYIHDKNNIDKEENQSNLKFNQIYDMLINFKDATELEDILKSIPN